MQNQETLKEHIKKDRVQSKHRFTGSDWAAVLRSGGREDQSETCAALTIFGREAVVTPLENLQLHIDEVEEGEEDQAGSSH